VAETKQAFLQLLGKLENQHIAFLRKVDGRVVLRVGEAANKPATKNWLLFFATVATTFTGYISFQESGLNPFERAISRHLFFWC
jgi:hypothetical protein